VSIISYTIFFLHNSKHFGHSFSVFKKQSLVGITQFMVSCCGCILKAWSRSSSVRYTKENFQNF
jgi:hypothetical protein